MLDRCVFVFPQGATVVDFAYHVHTDVGNHMKAAKVNGKPVHSDYALKNAEVRSLRSVHHGTKAMNPWPNLLQYPGCMSSAPAAVAVTPLLPCCVRQKTPLPAL